MSSSIEDITTRIVEQEKGRNILKSIGNFTFKPQLGIVNATEQKFGELICPLFEKFDANFDLCEDDLNRKELQFTRSTFDGAITESITQPKTESYQFINWTVIVYISCPWTNNMCDQRDTIKMTPFIYTDKL